MVKIFFISFINLIFLFSCTQGANFLGDANSEKKGSIASSKKDTLTVSSNNAQSYPDSSIQAEEPGDIESPSKYPIDGEDSPCANSEIKAKRFYRFVVNSVNIAGCPACCGGEMGQLYITELHLKWNCKYQKNAVSSDDKGTIGGLSVKVSAGSEVELHCNVSTGICPIYQAFDENPDLPYVSKACSYHFSGNYDVVDKDKEYVQIEFLDHRVALEGFKFDDWYGGGIADKFYWQYSDDGKNWINIPGSNRDDDTFAPSKGFELDFDP